MYDMCMYLQYMSAYTILNMNRIKSAVCSKKNVKSLPHYIFLTCFNSFHFQVNFENDFNFEGIMN